LAESYDARFVDEAGDLKHDEWMGKGGADVTDSWKASVGNR
jgi:hypothetical protein